MREDYFHPYEIIQVYIHVHVYKEYSIFSDKRLPKTSRLICGDRNANKIIECLSFIAKTYGEQVVILQYIPCAIDMVSFLNTIIC